jgi:small ligand-binding sensory domain FIST
VHVAIASSTHAGIDAARDEVVSRIGERGGPPADLLLLFASPHHGEEIGRLRDAVASVVAARHVVGCVASGVIAERAEIERGPAAVAVAIALDGARIEPFHLELEETGPGEAKLNGLALDVATDPELDAGLLFADPYSFPVDWFLDASNDRLPGFRWIGGIAAAGGMPGSTRLLVEDRVETSGAVGARIGGALEIATVVSQGCRPVGRHYVITKGSENLIEELSGVPALEQLQQLLGELPEADRDLLRRSLHVGRTTNEYKSRFERGDLLARSVIGIDQERRALAINDFVRRGQSIQFLVRDPDSARDDLRELLVAARDDSDGVNAEVALLFSCNGRGARLFGTSNHDVEQVGEVMRVPAVAGFFAAGEIGPVGGRNYLHGFTASVALLRARRRLGI